MSKKEKLIARLLACPKDFTFEEASALFSALGFIIDNKGKTSGARAKFIKGSLAYLLHKPHPANSFKSYAVKQMIDFLKDNKLI